MNKFCIVIPIYKMVLDLIEELSLTRIYNILKDKGYNIFFVCPENLDTSNYYNIVSKDFATEKRFANSYFENTDTYSQMCVSYNFYNTFKEYDYMYIMQLDVYLNYDCLDKFCDLGYDYIGSPILSTDCGWSTVKKINGKTITTPVVGNGGFSLRKIQTFIEITDPNGEYRKHYNLTDEKLSKVIYEDLYFCEFVNNRYEINICPYKIAFLFSWDMSVDIIYNNLGVKKLPMAIHAWDKNIRLWQDLLPELKDNKMVIDFCENKHKKFFEIYYDENNSTMR